MTISQTTSLDLFPTHVKIFDFEDDAALNQALLDFARTHPEQNSSLAGNLFASTEPAIRGVAERYREAVSAYLATTMAAPAVIHDVEAYAFLNHTRSTSFVPVHNHLIEADLVAIYYASAPQHDVERHDASYYAMQDGILVLHDPRLDASTDRRSLLTRDHYRIYPKPNRMVVHPGWISHSVTPNHDLERLAVTGLFLVNRKNLLGDYQDFSLVSPGK